MLRKVSRDLRRMAMQEGFLNHVKNRESRFVISVAGKIKSLETTKMAVRSHTTLGIDVYKLVLCVVPGLAEKILCDTKGRRFKLPFFYGFPFHADACMPAILYCRVYGICIGYRVLFGNQPKCRAKQHNTKTTHCDKESGMS